MKWVRRIALLLFGFAVGSILATKSFIDGCDQGIVWEAGGAEFYSCIRFDPREAPPQVEDMAVEGPY